MFTDYVSVVFMDLRTSRLFPYTALVVWCKGCAYCVVRTESLNIIQVNFCLYGVNMRDKKYEPQNLSIVY
jgi:hypothetical protein